MKFVVVLFLGLVGCSSVQTKDLLTDLSHCKRHYTGAVAIGTAGISDNATFTLQIDCDPMPGIVSGSTTTNPVPNN